VLPRFLLDKLRFSRENARVAHEHAAARRLIRYDEAFTLTVPSLLSALQTVSTREKKGTFMSQFIELVGHHAQGGSRALKRMYDSLRRSVFALFAAAIFTPMAAAQLNPSTLTTLVGRATAGTPTFTARCDYNNTPAIGDTVTVSVESLARMSDGSYILFDRGANCIHRLAGGNLTTIAGTGVAGNPVDGPALSTPMRAVMGLAVAPDGTIFFSDSDNNVIRKFTIGGNVSTVAGSATAGYVSTGYDNNITLAAARFNNPFGLALDSAGHLFVAEWRGRCVKRIDNAVTGATGVTRIAGYCATDGGGLPGGVFNDNVAAQDAVFDQLPALTFDAAGNLYIADAINRRIRKITAGANNLIDPTDLTATIAGTGASGSSGDGGPATAAVFSTVLGLAVDAGGDVHFGDIDTHRIRRVHAAGSISTTLGTGSAGFGVDQTGNLTALSVSRPNGFAVDPDGSIVFADQDNFRIRRMTLDATPTAFSFNALTNVPTNTAITSNIVVPTGFDSPASIRVSNGSYSIGCNGTFTTNAGILSPGQSVCVRVTSAAASNAATSATLTIGGAATSTAANFAVTTQNGIITAISASASSTCMVIDGGVQCWGTNPFGQLGNGSTSSSATPVQTIPAGSGATAISVGPVHACAVVAGGAKCWGYYAADNSLGVAFALGRGSSLSSNEPSNQLPADVLSLAAGAGVTAIAVGSRHTCAIVSGGAKCWGLGDSGRLGSGSTSSGVPGDVFLANTGVSLAGGVSTIAAGVDHTCATHGNGRSYCWGGNASNGGLAGGRLFFDATLVAQTFIPADIVVVFQSFSIGAGSYTSCGFNGTSARCVGDNRFGQQGGGAVGNPGGVGAFIPASAVASGANHTCAIVNGGAKCWGLAASGQLGTGGDVNSGTPADVLAFPPGTNAGVTHLALGDAHTCAVVNQQVRCWGANTLAPLGNFYDVSLSVTKAGSGTGLVTSSVGGISCGTTCNTATLPIRVNATVSLSALADAGFIFTGWSGVTCNEGQASASCTFTTSGNPGAANAATATFAPAVACAPGNYSPGGFEPCIAATAGSYVPTAGATAQIACPLGKYQPSIGAASCIDASIGNFVDGTGRTMQTPCAAGSYQPATGQTSCTPASGGHFVSATGAALQTPCAAGSYQPTSAQASCLPAHAGFFVPNAGATAQTPCPPGTSSNAAATVCFGLPLLNIDNSSPTTTYDAATDGVLLMRYLLGYRGAALIANALGTGVSLRDATQIETHIATSLALLDVDGDGETLAVTDGVMILRRLLNPNAAITNAAAMSAITAGAKRGGRSDADIVNAIDALKP
jgi:alpha-tubulin suppressor-like RCC1 family protein